MRSLYLLNWSQNFPPFTESEGSLPCSQEPTTGAYSEPHETSPYPTSHFFKNRFNIILPSIPQSSKWSPTNTQSTIVNMSRDDSVRIALGYGLDDRGSRVRFPTGAGNFSLHHRVKNGSGAYPASYPMGTRGSYPGHKAAGA
jgi:hypothetical protein